ncbi:CpsD/CapB family tyrosine-protein kinase [Marinicrinis lubricantis]|uniref:non-specific protein-tyrosine kinase n=1 Tax=Marinicrinis lubricantis TaxID=2086470 RepID=A0ABW1IJW6_9BACL
MSRSTRKWPLIAEKNPNSPISEAYKVMRTNIDFSNVDDTVQTVMITSSKMREGKSTTTANLAVAYAQSGKKVLIMDADLRNPTQHRIFQCSNLYGLSTLLSKQNTLDDVIQTTDVQSLDIIPAGPVPPNPSEMLSSKSMSELLEQLKEHYDVVLIDTPPVMPVSDAQIIAAQSDGVILVIDTGKVRKEMALKAKKSLEHVNARILGAVLNNVNRKRSESYYYYSYGVTAK